MMKTRFADVIFNLRYTVSGTKKKQREANPNAPVPVVMMRTGIEVLQNLLRMFCRRLRGHSPSILEKTMDSLWKYLSIRFRVLVQQEKMILLEINILSCSGEIYVPFCSPQVLLDILD